MNSELCKKGLEKVVNPNILINLISRRVRQFNAAAGAISRPLVIVPPTMGAADVALTEIVDGKMSWELLEPVPTGEPPPKKKKRH